MQEIRPPHPFLRMISKLSLNTLKELVSIVVCQTSISQDLILPENKTMMLPMFGITQSIKP